MKQPTLTTKSMILCALFAALTAVFSQIAIPLPFTAVPINLATLSVLMAGALLGAKPGLLSQLIYLLAGSVGIPVFSRFSGGFSVLLGPTGGYLIGYPLAALVTGVICAAFHYRRGSMIIAMIFGAVTYYLFGTAWYVISMHTPPLAALSACVFPFLPGDALKIAAAVFLTGTLRKRVYAAEASN